MEDACLKGLILKKLSLDVLVKTSWLILIVLFLYQFALVCTYSVDVPFKDEWTYLSPHHPLTLPENLTLNWLFARILEHTIVVTNIMTWINFKMFGLDLYKQKIINYVLFGILLALLIHYKNRLIGRNNFRMFPAFLFFLLSPIAVENHSWAFQSQFHLVLIFFLLMLGNLQSGRLSAANTAIFIFVSILAIYSFAAGVIMAAVCLVFRNMLLIQSVVADKCTKRNGLLHAAAGMIFIGGTIIYWFQGYERPKIIPPRSWPVSFEFWDYFLNLLSFGFGFDTQSILPGILVLILTVLPICLFIIDRKRRFNPGVQSLNAGLIAVLAVSISIAIGRIGVSSPKTSRYVEITFMLVPLVSMAWWLLLENSKAKYVFLLFLWSSCFFSFLDNWKPTLYLEAYQTDMATLDCIRNYYTFGGDAVCQEFWVTPAHLEKARRLNIHFMRQIVSVIQP